MSLKLLFIDIETSPIEAYVWDTYKPVITPDQIITPSSILCFSARWYGESKLTFAKALPDEANDHYRMIQKAHALLNEADAVCHYNGVSFDIPRLNREFLRLSMPPTAPVHQIDLLKTVREKFGMDSNKLAFIAPYLGIGEKVRNAGWELWKGCLANDRSSWRDMEKYNKQDVNLLVDLYNTILPWIDAHPNMNLYADSKEMICTHCGIAALTKRGVRRATTYVYQRYQCTACGRWCRDRKSNRLFGTTEVV